MSTLRLFCFFSAMLCLTHEGWSQDRYAVFFNFKPQSGYTLATPGAYLTAKAISRRGREKIAIDSLDLPVSQKYLLGIAPHAQEYLYSSKWLNAAVIVATSEGVKALQALPYVQRVSFVGKGFIPKTGNKLLPEQETKAPVTSVHPKWAGRELSAQTTPYDFQNQLIGINDMHKAGFTGKGITVAVFDAGFPGMQQAPAFAHLFANKRLLGQLDVVRPWNKDVFKDNQHGTNVASLIVANQPEVLVAGAYNAQVILAITEDVATEYPVEELNWVRAAEYADSLGVDVINSSLGYLDFDDPALTYTAAQLDGKTTYVTKGADIAAKKGILVVNSVGNYGAAGSSSLVAPADAKGILSVGSVSTMSTVSAFSSRGPTGDGRIKPELVAFGQGPVLIRSTGMSASAQGTSFSAPQVAALAAGLWEAKPEWTKEDLLQALITSGSQYKSPENTLGYGIPNFRGALYGSLLDLAEADENSFLLYPNPLIGEELAVIFGQELSVKIRLVDSVGRIIIENSVFRDSPKSPFRISLTGLPPGLYIVHLQDGKNLTQTKLIKQ
jgi:subtilisin family serine protease